jgi:hypothetical protein
MPFFLTIEDFLPFAGAAFLANFLFAARTVFMPCLSLGIPQPQVAHITSSFLFSLRKLAFSHLSYQPSYQPSLSAFLSDFLSAFFLGPLPNPGWPFFLPHPHIAHIIFYLS